MFTIDTSIKDLNVKERNIMKAFFSMNNHQVATPEMMSEEARSYVIFFSEAGGKISAFIGIHLLLTGRKLFYSHSSNPFPERDLGSVEEEARSFAEGLGAMLDEVSLATMSRDEKERWIERQDIFSSDREQSVIPAGAESLPPASAPEQPLEPGPVPPTPAVSPAPLEQAVQQQPEQHIFPEPDVSQTPAVAEPDPREKSEKRTEAAPVQQTERMESSEVSERANVKTAQSPASRERRDIAINAGMVKAQKPRMKKAVQSSTGVVSRDREALARLLASF
jgi:hypothetical protein